MMMHGLANPKSSLSLVLLFPFPPLYIPTKAPSKEGRAGTTRKTKKKKISKHFTSVTNVPSPYIPSNFSGFFLFFSNLRRVVTIKPKTTGNGFTEKCDIITTPVKD
jgi:hypothetical protein